MDEGRKTASAELNVRPRAPPSSRAKQDKRGSHSSGKDHLDDDRVLTWACVCAGVVGTVEFSKTEGVVVRWAADEVRCFLRARPVARLPPPSVGEIEL